MSLNMVIIKKLLLYCTRSKTGILQFSRNRFALLTLFLIYTCCLANAQELTQQQATFAWLDQLVGIYNLPVHSGKVYEEAHRIKSKQSKFFNSPEFTKGTVRFKDQNYHDLPLKYNVYDDELLLQIENNLGGNILQIDKPNVQSFAIGQHKFVHISDAMGKNEISSGYYEIAFEHLQNQLLLKHRKLLKRQLEGTQVYFEFQDLPNSVIFWYQNSYHALKDVDDLLILFPKYESDLLTYKAKLDKKLNTTAAVIKILGYLKEQAAFELSRSQLK